MMGIEVLMGIFLLGSVEGALNPEDSKLESFWRGVCTEGLNGEWIKPHTPEAECVGVKWSSVKD